MNPHQIYCDAEVIRRGENQEVIIRPIDKSKHDIDMPICYLKILKYPSELGPIEVLIVEKDGGLTENSVSSSLVHGRYVQDLPTNGNEYHYQIAPIKGIDLEKMKTYFESMSVQTPINLNF